MQADTVTGHSVTTSGRTGWLRSVDWLVLAAMLAQALMFAGAAWTGRGRWLYSDNILYEKPAWGLAQGHGLAFAKTEWEDPALTRLFVAAHPGKAGSEWVPAATFPPGYSAFLGVIYWLFGRSHLAAIIANGLLLMLSTLLAARLTGQLISRRSVYLLALMLVGTWPYSAYWASKIASDTLHTTLMLAFMCAWFSSEPSVRRTVVAGGLLAAATLVRPYTLLLPPVFLVAGLVWRQRGFAWRHVVILALVVWGAVGLWTARNYYQFRKPIMLTAMGPAIALYVTSYEYVEGAVPGWDKISADWKSIGVSDPHLVEEHDRLMAAAVFRIRSHPIGYLRTCARNLVRLWFPVTGSSDPGLRILWNGWLALLAGTAVVGLITIWSRADLRWQGALIVLAYYSTVFAPMAAEGRYLLPVRVIGFALSAVAVEAGFRRIARRGPALES